MGETNFFLHGVVLTPLSSTVFLLFTRLLFHTLFPDIVSLLSFSRLANKWEWLGLAWLGYIRGRDMPSGYLELELPISLFLSIPFISFLSIFKKDDATYIISDAGLLR
jgi:hypothetical protein